MNMCQLFRHVVSFAAAIIVASTLVATPVAAADPAPSFQNDVIPVLTRFGCNAGTCHGKLAGQNGFRLSLRGYAPDLDFETIAREGRGRRINGASPENSLLIRKATGRVPHGGGTRFEVGSLAERVLMDWIVAGERSSENAEARVQRIEVEPSTVTLAIGESQELRVTAVYDNEQRRDVTWLTQFASSDGGMLDVSEIGRVTALRNGEAVVRATFDGQVEIATMTVPYEAKTDPRWYTDRNNAIDDHVYAKLAALRIEPSLLCDDATFVRRAYLDAIGTLPSPPEVQAFLSDPKPDKRSRLVEQLLKRPEFVDFWALQLGDILQNRKERDHDVRGSKGVRAMHQWLRQQLAADRSWRDIATAVLLAEGPCDQNPAVGYYIVTVGEKSAEESEVADSVAQAFLGTRIGCARCHNHPLEKYTQDDFYHFASFFSRVSLDRQRPEEAASHLVVGTRHMLNLRQQIVQQQQKVKELQGASGESKQIEEATKRITDLENQIDAARQSDVQTRQPRTGENLKPRPLDGSTLEMIAGQDPRIPLVRWMTDPANENFSGAMVNRLWKHFLGVGLVEPVDDLRATNPPSNRELWKLLNREFVTSGYELRHVMRLIMNSRVYQLSAETRPANVRDARFYSHFYARRLAAEVLLDAICSATGEPESFPGYPLGVRAIQVPDPVTDSYFLTLFGRSERTTACACERSGDVTLPQLLHLQNSDGMYGKLKAPAGRLTKFLADQPDNNLVVEQLYLATLCRLPTAEERDAIAPLVTNVDRDEAMLDLFWALLNSKEFAFQH